MSDQKNSGTKATHPSRKKWSSILSASLLVIAILCMILVFKADNLITAEWLKAVSLIMTVVAFKTLVPAGCNQSKRPTHTFRES